MGGRYIVLQILAFSAACHGAALPEAGSLDIDSILDTFQNFIANPSMYTESFGVRSKRSTEDHTGYVVLPILMFGEVGYKYIDPANHLKGGEAFIHINDLQSHIPAAHSKSVKLHVKFDGGPQATDGLFTAEIDYHLEHKDGDGIEEGSFKIERSIRNGHWHTDIKTETKPFAGTPIITTAISNLELNIESDRQTMLKAHYVNPTKNRDISIDVIRVPGKSVVVKTSNNGQESTITGVRNGANINIKANIRGIFTGLMILKQKPDKTTEILIKITKGSEEIFKAKLEKEDHRLKGHYSVMGGKVGSGTFDVHYENEQLVLNIAPYVLTVDIKLGEKMKMVTEKNGEILWTYETERGDKSTADAFIYEAESKMVFTEFAATQSMLLKMIKDHYPFGAFMTRSNTFRIFVDKHDRNNLLPKFKINFDVIKDGNNVIDLVADTTAAPYNFVFSAPNLFTKLGIQQPSVIVTIDHVRGDHLNINANVGGGLELHAKQTPNSKGGRNIEIETKKGGVEMLKYKAETSKINDAAIFKVGLKGDLTLNHDSILYRTIVTKYRILTPFVKRLSDVEFTYNKVDKNVLMNKFSIKAKVDKDATNVLNLEISTDHTPYKIHIFCPAIFNKVRPGMTEIDVTVDHVMGVHLFVNVNHAGARWKGFKITTVGQEREIEWNGVKLGKGSYSLTDNRFTTTQTLSDGRSLTTTITWKNKFGDPSFLLDNKVSVVLDGTERRLNLDMDWKMDQTPDLNPATPDNGDFKMVAAGHNARWGDYSANRELKWGSQNGIISVEWKGDASFENGPLASRSPIHTDIHFSYNIGANDLTGKFMKVMAGKEYSITFPQGSFNMPSIKLGA